MRELFIMCGGLGLDHSSLLGLFLRNLPIPWLLSLTKVLRQTPLVRINPKAVSAGC
jgi:hypothetical protein